MQQRNTPRRTCESRTILTVRTVVPPVVSPSSAPPRFFALTGAWPMVRPVGAPSSSEHALATLCDHWGLMDGASSGRTIEHAPAILCDHCSLIGGAPRGRAIEHAAAILCDHRDLINAAPSGRTIEHATATDGAPKGWRRRPFRACKSRAGWRDPPHIVLISEQIRVVICQIGSMILAKFSLRKY